MKHFPFYAILILLIATLACGGTAPAAAPEPTDTVVIPSNTPVPTDTSLPTDTPTPLPTATATPDAKATAAVRATQSAGEVVSELDKLLGDSDVPYSEGHLAWQQTDAIAIKMSGPDYRISELDEGLSAGNFIFKSDVTWDATGLMICGAIFRSEPDLLEGKQYQFMYLRLSGLPAWEIDVFEFGSFKNSPSGTKTAGAIDLNNGATNTFLLVVQDDNFTLYLNGVRQGRYYDYSKQRMDGSFGFLGAQDSGNGTCKFENSWVWSLD